MSSALNASSTPGPAAADRPGLVRLLRSVQRIAVPADSPSDYTESWPPGYPVSVEAFVIGGSSNPWPSNL